MNERLNGECRDCFANVAFWVRSDLSAFGQLKRVLHINAEVAHRAVDLGMSEKDLNGAETARRLVDDRCSNSGREGNGVMLTAAKKPMLSRL